MREWLIALAALFISLAFCKAASAETNLVWSPTGTNRDIGTWQYAAPTTRVLTGTSWGSSTITTFQQVPATGNVFICLADRPVGAGAGCPSPGNYSQEAFRPKSQARTPPAPPPTCPPPQPSQESQLVTCPPPTVGNWTQTRTYSCNAPNWVPGPWTPATPPDGVCAEPPPPPPPPPGVPRNIAVFISFESCSISGSIASEIFPQWIEAQRLGSTEIIRSADNTNAITCEQLGLTTPGEAVYFRIRTAHGAGQSVWTGYWPVLRFNQDQADPALRDHERVKYEIVKNRLDGFTLACPAP